MGDPPSAGALPLVDELYEELVGALEPSMARCARQLARVLRLAPVDGLLWSQVFGHEVTVAAPVLFAGAMPRLAVGAVRDAAGAHLFAVLVAFAVDRIEDGQVEATADLTALLARLRRQRDEAAERLRPGGAQAFDVAEQTSLAAIRTERRWLRAGHAVTLEAYERVSLDKQHPGLVATRLLVDAAGWSPRRGSLAARALADVALGLQAFDDARDWEQDLVEGGCWAACLLAPDAAARPRAPSDLRERVLASGVLGSLLERARRRMRLARRAAGAIGASKLEQWAGVQEVRLASLRSAEARSPGYSSRARALGPWAAEVLA